MCKTQKIRINGKSVEVSTEIYDIYIQGERKSRYFTDDLKREKIIVNQEKETVTFIPSREDSFDRLKDENKIQFMDDSESVENKVLKTLMIEKLFKSLVLLDSDERKIIDAIYYEGKTEREISAETGIPQKTINNRKRKILAKLKKFMDN